MEILYELAATFHLWDLNRMKLLDLMTPLYYARVASFVRESWEMSSREAEKLVEDQAAKFEAAKDYLVKVWDEKSARKAESGNLHNLKTDRDFVSDDEPGSVPYIISPRLPFICDPTE